MKKIFGLIVIIAMVFLSLSNTHLMAATISASIEGLDSPIAIESYSIKFAVTDQIVFENFQRGDAVPAPVGNLGWDGGISSKDGVMTVFDANWDYLNDTTSNPLTNGKLFSFDYTGGILGLTNFWFFDETGEYTYDIEIINADTWMQDGQIRFARAIVPIPPSIVLFGFGLFGFFSVRYRQKMMST